MENKYIIIGTSRSRKSTIAGLLQKQIGGKLLDVMDYVFRFISKMNISQKEPDFRVLKVPYEKMCLDIENGQEWNILELASDYPEVYLPKIFSATNIPVKIIFCHSPLEVCLKRNQEEKRQVPEAIIRNQSKYDKDFYLGLSIQLGIELIVLDTNKPSDESFQDLLHKLHL